MNSKSSNAIGISQFRCEILNSNIPIVHMKRAMPIQHRNAPYIYNFTDKTPSIHFFSKIDNFPDSSF